MGQKSTKSKTAELTPTGLNYKENKNEPLWFSLSLTIAAVTLKWKVFREKKYANLF